MSKEIFSPATLPPPTGYSHIAKVNNGTLVYIAGQVGNPGDDVATQTKTALAAIDRLLGEAGTDKSRLLSTTIWLEALQA